MQFVLRAQHLSQVAVRLAPGAPAVFRHLSPSIRMNVVEKESDKASFSQA